MDIQDLPSVEDMGDVKGKKVLLRLSLNVPIKNRKIVDDFRIEAGLRTVEYLRERGAKVIIISHIGREAAESLIYVADYIEQSIPLTFVENIMIQETVNVVDEMKDGDVVMFENLRRYSGEVNNDPAFAEHLAHFADYFVNDAFSVGHREHASIVGIPKYLPTYFGLQFVDEVKYLSRAFDPEHPFVFILGGAKVETKKPLLLKFLGEADTIFIGGVLANDFFKVKGYSVGDSVVSAEKAPAVIADRDDVMLPSDVTVLRKGEKVEVKPDEVKDKDLIYDVGSVAIEELCAKIKEAKFVLWNGPLGYCEKGFCKGTEEVAKVIASSDVESILGGGDTLAAIDDSLYDDFSFVSTAGGAMLEFLADETLPAIQAVDYK